MVKMSYLAALILIFGLSQEIFAKQKADSSSAVHFEDLPGEVGGVPSFNATPDMECVHMMKVLFDKDFVSLPVESKSYGYVKDDNKGRYLFYKVDPSGKMIAATEADAVTYYSDQIKKQYGSMKKIVKMLRTHNSYLPRNLGETLRHEASKLQAHLPTLQKVCSPKILSKYLGLQEEDIFKIDSTPFESYTKGLKVQDWPPLAPARERDWRVQKDPS